MLASSASILLAFRAFESQRGPDLEPWHTFRPSEVTRAELEALDWAGYLEKERALFAEVLAQVTAALPAEDRVPVNRYFAGSPVHPASFATDWNRSFVLEPEGEPRGAAVLLHGLTDSPYSMRHVAERYRELGLIALAIRLPGHGTVPGSLAEVAWPDWSAATRLAVREARRRAGNAGPLHLVGYSTGGALALQYALDALDDEKLERPDRIVLLSPMIGITAFARFAGLLGLPALLPSFAKAAWISVVPEFNPFKYNSFPVNAARQSSLLSRALQDRLSQAARSARLEGLAPVLTFQSVVDFTVSTRAVVSTLYTELPGNGSELVLFDLNRRAKLDLLLNAASDVVARDFLPAAPRRFSTTLLTNQDSTTGEVQARTLPAGASAEVTHPLGIAYPKELFSLSHVAVPFPIDDGLYGMEPDPSEDFGVRLGAMAPRGERGALVVSLDFLGRAASNPFFPFVLERIEAAIEEDASRGPGAGSRTAGAGSASPEPEPRALPW